MDQFIKTNPNPINTNNNNKIIVEDETLLLIVDVQQQLIKNIKDNQQLIFNIKKLIDTCKLLNVRIAITEQNPLKLGKTLESIQIIMNILNLKKWNLVVLIIRTLLSI